MVETSAPAQNSAQTDLARAPTQFVLYPFVRRNSFAEKLSNVIFEKLNEQVPYFKLKILDLAWIWNHPISYFLVTSIAPIAHLLCWIYYLYIQPIMPNIFLIKPLLDFLLGCFACNAILILIITPAVDYVISYNKHVNEFFFEHAKTLEKSAEKVKGVSKKQQTNMYNMILYGFCAIYFANYAITIWNIRKIPLFSWAFLFQILSTSFANVPAQGVAHELVHKLNKANVFLGKCVLSVILYNHFYLEHVYSHHKWVGTPLDAATARRGETLYQFIPRSVSMGYVHAWQYERERLKSKGISFWSLQHNRMLHYHAIYLGLPSLLFYIFGAKTLFFFLAVAVFSIGFVETVNYFEHYGLTRKIIGVENGVVKYEPVSIKHSWDAVYRMISWMALNIPLHSDHHAHPLRDFYELQLNMEAPMMPYTYSIMFVLSFSPSTFMGVMHPLLDKLKEEQEK